jgi:hypothetical protein
MLKDICIYPFYNKMSKSVKKKEDKDHRDATKQARGFTYQRLWCINLFFKKNMQSIIDEGSIDGKTYEDITLITCDGDIITYQIKCSEATHGLCISGNISKTLSNKNNLNTIKLYYIVSKNKKTFDKTLKKWLAQDYKASDKLEDINDMLKKTKNKYKYNKEKPTEKQIKFLDDFVELFENTPDEKLLNYLDIFKLKEGISYDEINKEINKKIKTLFELADDDVLEISYVFLYIFKSINDKWFSNKNTLLNIPDIIKLMKEKIKSKEDIKEFVNTNLIKCLIPINNRINLINDRNDYECNMILNELFIIINNNKDIFDIKYTLIVINLLHKLNDVDERDDKSTIKREYKRLLMILSRNILKTDINNLTNCIIDDIIVSSHHYYYTHDIQYEINMNNNIWTHILTKKEKDYICRNTKNKPFTKKELEKYDDDILKDILKEILIDNNVQMISNNRNDMISQILRNERNERNVNYCCQNNIDKIPSQQAIPISLNDDNNDGSDDDDSGNDDDIISDSLDDADDDDTDDTCDDDTSDEDIDTSHENIKDSIDTSESSKPSKNVVSDEELTSQHAIVDSLDDSSENVVTDDSSENAVTDDNHTENEDSYTEAELTKMLVSNIKKALKDCNITFKSKDKKAVLIQKYLDA